VTTRIAIGGILHESNTFSSVPTTLADFGVQRGAEILAEWENSQHEMGGFIEGGLRFGFEIYPTLMAAATPAGPVTDDALDRLTAELIDRLKAAPPLQAVLLALHGAMVTESFPAGDAEVLRRVRAALGPAFPLVVTHDFHGNIPQDVVDLSTALVIYKTCPHPEHECGTAEADCRRVAAVGTESENSGGQRGRRIPICGCACHRAKRYCGDG
jgi:microcystin degradation protein MlrC